MFDLAGFLSGLIGALIGGAATLGVTLSTRLAERMAQRSAAVAEIDRAISVLLIEGANRTASNPNTTAFFAAIRDADSAVVTLRLVLRRREVHVANWMDREVHLITSGIAGSSPAAKEAIDRARSSTRQLAEWAAGRVRAAWFDAELRG